MTTLLSPSVAPPSVKVGVAERKLVSGIRWSAFAQVATMAVKLGSTLMLTRLLAPEAYGLFGTMMVVLTTVELLSDIGMLPALLRHPRGDRSEWLLVGWWIGLFRSVAIALALLACSHPLAAFYERPELAALLMAVSLRPIIFGLRSPGVPMLRRRMDFRSLFIDEFIQTVVGVGASVLAASIRPDLGAWALIAGTLAGALAGCAASFVLAPFRVRWKWDWAIAKELGGFGRMIFLNTLVMAFWMGLDRLVGPWAISFEAMGFYIVAMNLAMVAEGLLTRATDVYFSSILQSPDRGERERRHDACVAKLTSRLMPIACLAIISAPLAVMILYRPIYAESGMILAVLLARLIPRAIGQLDFQMLLVRGSLRPSIVAYTVGAVAQLCAMPPLIHWFGTLGLAYSFLASTIVVTWVQGRLSGGSRGLGLAVAWAAVGIIGAMGLDWLIHAPAR